MNAKQLFSLILLILMFQVDGISQRFQYSSFLNVGFHECTIDILLDDSRLGFEVFVENFSLDDTNRGECAYILTADTYTQFCFELLAIETKYEEWIKVAKANKVTKLQNKTMDSDFPQMFTVFNVDKFCADDNVEPKVVFDIISMSGETNYCLTILSGQMIDMTDPSQVHGGMMLNFLDLKSFSVFVDLLEYNNIMRVVRIQKAKGGLFK